jgi:hypothetical protein
MVKSESLAKSVWSQLVPISLSLRSPGSIYGISIVTLAARLGRYIQCCHASAIDGDRI